MKDENEGDALLGKIKDQYCYDNGFLFGFATKGPERCLFRNYDKFSTTLISFKIREKIDEAFKKLKSKDETNIIYKELNNIVKEYNDICEKSKNNLFFYGKMLDELYFSYTIYSGEYNGVGRIFDKTTGEIINLLNKDYIHYEKNLINLSQRLIDLNLKLK
jgi:hypothetical protein